MTHEAYFSHCIADHSLVLICKLKTESVCGIVVQHVCSMSLNVLAFFPIDIFRLSWD